MGVVERRQREKEAVREQILAAATELFASEGIRSVSMRKIADKIEYAPSTIYLYFKDKEELCSAIIVEAFGDLTKILKEIHAANYPPLEALEKGLRAYIQFGIDHPHHYAVIFGQSWMQNFPKYVGPADQASIECFDQLRRALIRCMDAGLIQSNQIDLLSQTIWMFIHGTTDVLMNTAMMCKNSEFPWAHVPTAIDKSLELIMKAIQK